MSTYALTPKQQNQQAQGLTSSPIPGVASYGQAADLAQRAYANALAQAKQGSLNQLRQFGYEADVDPTTAALQHVRVAASNPYGAYQQMLRSHAMSDQQLTADAEDRGIHGGLANHMLSDARFGYGGDAANLGQQVVGVVSDYGNQLQNAAYARDEALYQAELDNTRQAITDGNFNPADYSGLEYPPYDPGPYPLVPAIDDGNPTNDNTTDPGVVARQPNRAARNRLLKQLVSRGVVPSAWAKGHPQQAATLGISTKYGGNNQAIKQAYGNKPIPKPAPKPKPKPKPRGR